MTKEKCHLTLHCQYYYLLFWAFLYLHEASTCSKRILDCGPIRDILSDEIKRMFKVCNLDIHMNSQPGSTPAHWVHVSCYETRARQIPCMESLTNPSCKLCISSWKCFGLSWWVLANSRFLLELTLAQKHPCSLCSHSQRLFVTKWFILVWQ